jgi:hypothetical protein
MGLLGTLLGMFGDSTACGDRETLIQPGGWVNVGCMSVAMRKSPCVARFRSPMVAS